MEKKLLKTAFQRGRRGKLRPIINGELQIKNLQLQQKKRRGDPIYERRVGGKKNKGKRMRPNRRLSMERGVRRRGGSKQLLLQRTRHGEMRSPLDPSALGEGGFQTKRRVNGGKGERVHASTARLIDRRKKAQPEREEKGTDSDEKGG